ncbi:MAG: AmmeMemoRadiSam system radical SAM enzyme [Dehalococcoidia bacterium]|nr:AmmeMemoRadiSam system radical SAM enzyme [Dehalococcoidia bacterium]
MYQEIIPRVLTFVQERSLPSTVQQLWFINDDGTLNALNYAMVSSAAIDPIEKKPLFHFFPGTQVFSLGSWGCNFHCSHCQNWEISCAESPGRLMRGSRLIPPQEAIALTKQHGCAGIAWTYNEPIIWFEYTLDSAKLARENGLYTVYVTNGYMTPEALDTVGPFLDAWRVDIKGFSGALYKNLAKIPRWRGILETSIRAKEKWGMHVEVVTNIIPTVNDDEGQLRDIATWIQESLGELTPWHVTRFYPQYNLRHLPPTTIASLERVVKIGKQAGLRFIYVGNVPGHDGENTVCYNCGKLNITRHGHATQVDGLDGPQCKYCGVHLNIRFNGGVLGKTPSGEVSSQTHQPRGDEL